LGIIILSLLIATTFLGVFYRYVLSNPLLWTEEIARLFFVWMSFVGAWYVTRIEKHIAVNILLRYIPKGLASVLRIFKYIVMSVFLVVLIWQGMRVVESVEGINSTTIGFPLVILHASVPVAGIAMLVWTFIHLYNTIKEVCRPISGINHPR